MKKRLNILSIMGFGLITTAFPVLSADLSPDIANGLLQSTIQDFDYFAFGEIFGVDFTENEFTFTLDDSTWKGQVNGTYLDQPLNVNYLGDFSNYNDTGLINWTSQGAYKGEQWNSSGTAQFSGESKTGITVDIDSSLSIGSNTVLLDGVYNVYDTHILDNKISLVLNSGSVTVNDINLTAIEPPNPRPKPGDKCFAKGNPRTITYETFFVNLFDPDPNVPDYESFLNKLTCNLRRGEGEWALTSKLVNVGNFTPTPPQQNQFVVSYVSVPESSSTFPIIGLGILGAGAIVKRHLKSTKTANKLSNKDTHSS